MRRRWRRSPRRRRPARDVLAAKTLAQSRGRSMFASMSNTGTFEAPSTRARSDTTVVAPAPSHAETTRITGHLAVSSFVSDSEDPRSNPTQIAKSYHACGARSVGRIARHATLAPRDQSEHGQPGQSLGLGRSAHSRPCSLYPQRHDSPEGQTHQRRRQNDQKITKLRGLRSGRARTTTSALIKGSLSASATVSSARAFAARAASATSGSCTPTVRTAV